MNVSRIILSLSMVSLSTVQRKDTFKQSCQLMVKSAFCFDFEALLASSALSDVGDGGGLPCSSVPEAVGRCLRESSYRAAE